MTERIRIRLDSDIAALIGPSGAAAMIGTELPFRSREESITARVADAEFTGSGLMVTLAFDEELSARMRQLIHADQSGLRVRVSGAPVPQAGAGVVDEQPGGQGRDHV